MDKQCSCDKLDECNGENCTYKEKIEIPIDNIKEILGYLWADEEKSYEEQNKPENHIFIDIQKVGEWIDNITQ